MPYRRSQEIYARLRELNVSGEVWALFAEIHNLQNMHPDILAAELRREKDRERKRVSTESTETHIILDNNKTPEGGCGGKPRSVASTEFEVLWKRYPLKKSKGKALKAFPAARKIATFDELSAGVDRLIAEKRDPKFWPYFASWLNALGWLDEPERKLSVVGTPQRTWAEQKDEYRARKGDTA